MEERIVSYQFIYNKYIHLLILCSDPTNCSIKRGSDSGDTKTVVFPREFDGGPVLEVEEV